MASAAEEDPVQHGEKGLSDGNDRNRNAGGDKSGLDRVRTLREVYDETAHGFASRQRRIFSPVTSAKLTANRFEMVKSPVRKNTKCLPVKAGESKSAIFIEDDGRDRVCRSSGRRAVAQASLTRATSALSRKS
jgi:hypothetical protein